MPTDALVLLFSALFRGAWIALKSNIRQHTPAPAGGVITRQSEEEEESRDSIWIHEKRWTFDGLKKFCG
jgi:hypothetical protein